VFKQQGKVMHACLSNTPELLGPGAFLAGPGFNRTKATIAMRKKEKKVGASPRCKKGNKFLPSQLPTQLSSTPLAITSVTQAPTSGTSQGLFLGIPGGVLRIISWQEPAVSEIRRE